VSLSERPPDGQGRPAQERMTSPLTRRGGEKRITCAFVCATIAGNRHCMEVPGRAEKTARRWSWLLLGVLYSSAYCDRRLGLARSADCAARWFRAVAGSSCRDDARTIVDRARRPLVGRCKWLFWASHRARAGDVGHRPGTGGPDRRIGCSRARHSGCGVPAVFRALWRRGAAVRPARRSRPVGRSASLSAGHHRDRHCGPGRRQPAFYYSSS